MSTILTAAGESLIARLQAEGKALIIDTMILANVPGQDHTQGSAPGVTVPAEDQIALRYAIPPQYRAYVNPNQVVYSAMLGSDLGDFVFNWQGLWCSEHNTLVAVATFPALEKRRYDEANGKTGNNLTRNFLLTFTGARELTGLTISADVWQLDFTVRLNGIDERQRLANFDIYGQAFFDAQGWLLQKTAEAYAFAPGLGYVGGIRAALAESLPLAAPESANLPQNVWLDVCLKHTGSDRIAEASPMLTPPAAPLADSAADETGLMHYRALVARIEADGTVTDLRPRKNVGILPIPGVDGITIININGTLTVPDVYVRLKENLTVYVATTGSDSNDGLTADTPMRTVQGALNKVSTSYNLGEHMVTISVAEGTYTESVALPKYQASTGSIKIVGAGIDKTIVGGAGSGAIALMVDALYTLQDMTLTAANGSGNNPRCVLAMAGSITCSNAKFVLPASVTGPSPVCIYAYGSGQINLGINDGIPLILSIASATAALFAVNGGKININNPLTISGTMSGACAYAFNLGVIFRNQSTMPAISGAVTGGRYQSSVNGVINTYGGGASYFPGTIAGNVSMGGQYA